MQKAFRFIGLLAVFAFIVGCCAKSVPPIDIKTDIPIKPDSVLFIGAANAVTGETISGSAIVVGQEKNWSWAISAGHAIQRSLMVW